MYTSAAEPIETTITRSTRRASAGASSFVMEKVFCWHVYAKMKIVSTRSMSASPLTTASLPPHLLRSPA